MDQDEFLKKKGAADLMFEISEGPKTFNELVDLIRLGPNTVLSRLREAQSLGLVEERLERKESGRPSISYAITHAGKKAIEPLISIRINYIKLKKELNELKEREKEKEAKITQLLSTKSSTDSKTSISGNKIIKSRDVKLSINNKDISK